MEHFWVVWNELGRAPTVKHDHPNKARAEAERLAAANPGYAFHVLGVIGTAQTPRVTWHEYGEFIPF